MSTQDADTCRQTLADGWTLSFDQAKRLLAYVDELEARPAPIGYAVVFEDDEDIEVAQRAYRSITVARATREDYFRPAWRICALVPVPEVSA